MQSQVSRLWVTAAAVLLAVACDTKSDAARDQNANQQAQSASQQQQQAGTASNQTDKVDLDELEDAPEKYEGKTITVEGEVDRVLGPHLFTIDEPDWGDAEREMAVVVPEPFTAVVRRDVPVRVTGTVKKVPVAEIERDRGFAGDPKIQAEIETQPVLVASEVTTIAPTVVSLRVRPEQPVGTSGTNAGGTVTNVGEVAGADDTSLVGRRVNLTGASVSSSAGPGFWITAPGGERIFVLPAAGTALKQAKTASIEGVVLEFPEGLRVKVDGGKEQIYIYADRVTGR